jgi:hypothetical protein
MRSKAVAASWSSPRAASGPRRENRSRIFLRLPVAGSRLRRARLQRAWPSPVRRRCAMAWRAVTSAGGGPWAGSGAAARDWSRPWPRAITRDGPGRQLHRRLRLGVPGCGIRVIRSRVRGLPQHPPAAPHPEPRASTRARSYRASPGLAQANALCISLWMILVNMLLSRFSTVDLRGCGNVDNREAADLGQVAASGAGHSRSEIPAVRLWTAAMHQWRVVLWPPFATART